MNRDNMVKLYNKNDGNSIKFNLTNIFFTYLEIGIFSSKQLLLHVE